MTQAHSPAQPRLKPAKRGFAGREALAECLIFPEVEGFRIHGKLGRGGMAHVYSAIDSDDRLVAIKVVRKVPPEAPNHHVMHWFERECAATLLVSHPNIVSSFGMGESDYYRYLLLEKIDGKSLFQLLASKKPTAWEDARKMLAGISRGLEEIHHAGIVHRDLKPENVLVARGSGAKIIDFGLCHIDGYDEIYSHIHPSASAPRLSLATAGFGTPEFRPPEFDVPLASASPAYDIYSAGLVFYNIVRGDLPFSIPRFGNIYERAEFFANLHKNLVFLPPSASGAKLPDAAEEAMMACLGKDPSGRPSASELVKVFESC